MTAKLSQLFTGYIVVYDLEAPDFGFASCLWHEILIIVYRHVHIIEVLFSIVTSEEHLHSHEEHE